MRFVMLKRVDVLDKTAYFAYNISTINNLSALKYCTKQAAEVCVKYHLTN